MERIETISGYALRLPDGVFPLTRESLLLGDFAGVTPRARVCDLGSGSGVLPLLLLAREGSLAVTAVELDPFAAGVCTRNLADNGFAADVVCGDLRDRSLLRAGSFDLVVSNPPWYPLGSGTSGGSERSEETCTLDEVCAAAARLLRNGGHFSLVHRPERLADLITALRAHGLEPKTLRLCHHSPDARPFCVLLDAVRQGRPGLTVLPPFLGEERSSP